MKSKINRKMEYREPLQGKKGKYAQLHEDNLIFYIREGKLKNALS